MIIREAKIEDLNGVVDVQYICFPQSFFVKLGKINKGILKLYNEKFMQKYPSLFLVAEDENNKIVGFTIGYEVNKVNVLRQFERDAIRYIWDLRILCYCVYYCIKKLFCSLFKRNEEDNSYVILNSVVNPELLEKCSTHLFYIAVLPECRGSNVASLLIDSFVYASKERQKRFITLYVNEKNARALNFYKKCCFELYAKLGQSDYCMMRRVD